MIDKNTNKRAADNACFFTNYHTHSCFCDGIGHPEDYVKQALALGFEVLGFTSHGPLPIDNVWSIKKSRLPEYCETIEKLKIKYKDKIEILLSLEIEYIDGVMGPDSPVIKKLDLDYTLASIHYLQIMEHGRQINIDSPADEFAYLLHNHYDGNIQSLVETYYSRIRKMVLTQAPDIIGHLDLIKKNNKNNRYFNENDKWYRDQISETLDTIATGNSIIEVNTGGMAKGNLDVPYPSPWIMEESRKRNIPVLLNSDAHSPENLTAYLTEAARLMRRAGYKTQRVLIDGVWTDIALPSD